jgi:hypothetical protein
MPSGTHCVLRGCDVGQTTRSVADGIPTEDRGNEGECPALAISEGCRYIAYKVLADLVLAGWRPSAESMRESKL